MIRINVNQTHITQYIASSHLRSDTTRHGLMSSPQTLTLSFRYSQTSASLAFGLRFCLASERHSISSDSCRESFSPSHSGLAAASNGQIRRQPIKFSNPDMILFPRCNNRMRRRRVDMCLFLAVFVLPTCCLSALSAAEFNISPGRWHQVWLVAIAPPERWGKMDRNGCHTAWGNFNTLISSLNHYKNMLVLFHSLCFFTFSLVVFYLCYLVSPSTGCKSQRF
jgi:hypothetical protein